MIVPGICDISDWEERVVFVRASVNVPLTKDGEIADDFRIQRLLPTVHYLVEQEAKVVIIGHIGRDRQATLEPVRDRLAEDIELDYMPDFFARDIDTSLGELDEWIAGAAGGSVVLLDNVRSTPKEQANDETLAQVVAQRGDVYVNEAFAASHRMHMSLDALPRSISQAVAGFTCLEEIEALQDHQITPYQDTP
jgi:phosphoglycerate kinase